MSTQIDALPSAPAATDSVDEFDAKAFAFTAALGPFGTQANALGSEMQANADVAAALINAMSLPQFAGTSTSSVLVGTGARNFVTQSGKAWIPGQIVVCSSGANYVKGTITAYSGTSLDVNVTSVSGSGTYASWTIGLSYDGLALAKSGAITASGLTQATASILGRTTAGAGAIEEISMGATLDLLAGVLGVKDASIGGAKLSGAQSGSAPVFGIRAWAMFNGTVAGTNAPTAGGNITSITRVSAGYWRATYTTAMPDANVGVVGMAKDASGGASAIELHDSVAPTTTTVDFYCRNSGSGIQDNSRITIFILR